MKSKRPKLEKPEKCACKPVAQQDHTEDHSENLSVGRQCRASRIRFLKLNSVLENQRFFKMPLTPYSQTRYLIGMKSNEIESGRDGLSVCVGDSDAEEVSVDVPDTFHVHNERTANWVLRHIVAAVAYRRHVKKWAEAEVRRAEREEEWFRRRFGAELAEWARQQIAQSKGRRKSVKLPAGVLGFRTIGAKLVVDDEKAVLTWAKSHCPKAIIMIRRIDKHALNKLFEEAGEIPDEGAHVEPSCEKFYAR